LKCQQDLGPFLVFWTAAGRLDGWNIPPDVLNIHATADVVGPVVADARVGVALGAGIYVDPSLHRLGVVGVAVPIHIGLSVDLQVGILVDVQVCSPIDLQVGILVDLQVLGAAVLVEVGDRVVVEGSRRPALQVDRIGDVGPLQARIHVGVAGGGLAEFLLQRRVARSGCRRC